MTVSGRIFAREGLRRAREFSWDHTARRVRAIYDEVLAG